MPESSQERFAARQLALLCDRLGADGDPLATPGPMRELALALIAAVRAGRAPVELTDEFDRLDEQLLRAGYAAGLGTYRSGPYSPLPGIGDGHPVLRVLGCPGERCPRVALPAGTGTAPACSVFDRPLREVRLRS
jgi:hypothetical protein